MAYQESVQVRNAKLDAIEVAVGVAPVLIFYTGTQPVNCATADSGTVLATMTLPADWLAAASGGSKAKLGTWQDVSADATGTLGYWRIKDSSATTCHMQGSVTLTAGGGQITVDNVSISTGQQFAIVSFTLTAGNA